MIFSVSHRSPWLRYLACLTGSVLISSCWVPQVVEGVRPQIFDASPTPPPEVARQSLTSKEVALATRMIEISQTTANLFATHATIAQQRQAVANHLYYNVKQSNFALWRYQAGDYVYYDTQKGHQYTLALQSATGEKPAFDVLGLDSYGAAPLPAQRFPKVQQYMLNLSETRYGKSLGLQTQGRWPDQVPLRDGFITDVTGTGIEPNVDLGFEDLTLTLSGKVDVSASFTGELSFVAKIEGRSYSGFGRLDASGYLNTVNLQHNGVPLLSIERSTATTVPHWNVIKAGQVLGSVS
jgi:hypothetical protein